MNTQQPEALRLAEDLDAYHTRPHHREAANELRRLHEVNTELLEALKYLLKAVEWTETRPVHNLTSLGRGMAKANAAIAKATGETK